MKTLLLVATLAVLSILGAARCPAQSIDDLNLQIHGYATQGFAYSTNNNWDTTNSTDGSAAWTEAVVNLTAQPSAKFRVGMQGRYFLLGNYGNTIALDWAQADYKFSEKFGFRVGKVKTPAALLNEIQDIDPAYLWILLPQSIYPLASRNSTLSHFGGVVYGEIALSESLGKLQYRGFGGQLVIASDDGFLQSVRDGGINFPNGVSGPTSGGSLRWRSPVRGLLVGASEVTARADGDVTLGLMRGTSGQAPTHIPFFFGQYERARWTLAGEYSRIIIHAHTDFPGLPAIQFRADERHFYGMASFKISGKLGAGIYYSSSNDHQASFSSARYQKDWSLSGRYDFNPYVYLKAEQHFIDGAGIGLSTMNNADGLRPNSRMSLLKLGVSF